MIFRYKHISFTFYIMLSGQYELCNYYDGKISIQRMMCEEWEFIDLVRQMCRTLGAIQASEIYKNELNDGNIHKPGELSISEDLTERN